MARRVAVWVVVRPSDQRAHLARRDSNGPVTRCGIRIIRISSAKKGGLGYPVLANNTPARCGVCLRLAGFKPCASRLLGCRAPNPKGGSQPPAEGYLGRNDGRHQPTDRRASRT